MFFMTVLRERSYTAYVHMISNTYPVHTVYVQLPHSSSRVFTYLRNDFLRGVGQIVCRNNGEG
jgi:hypothetical protein